MELETFWFYEFKTINPPSGGKVNNFSHNGTCKDSLENYGKGFCYGIIESRENKDSFFQLYWELSNQDTDKFSRKVQENQKILKQE